MAISASREGGDQKAIVLVDDIGDEGGKLSTMGMNSRYTEKAEAPPSLMRTLVKTDVHHQSERVRIEVNSKSPEQPPPITTSTRNAVMKRNMNMSIDSAVSAMNKAKVKELFQSTQRGGRNQTFTATQPFQTVTGRET